MGGKQIPPIDYFEGQTTQRNDYRWPMDVKRDINSQTTKQKKEILLKKPAPITHMDVETLVPYTPGTRIPFTLHWQRKPILQTIPKENFNLKLLQESPKDDSNIRFTRPRVYKAPEISLDDISDKETREMIIDYIYKSTWNNDSRGVAGNTTHINIPTTTWQSPLDDNVGFKEGTFFSASEQEWSQKCGKEWDKLQTCFTSDTDKVFWQENQKEKAKLKTSAEVPYALLDHIIKLEREDKLRMPFRIPVLGYTGFMPSNPFNIKPEKKNLKPTDCQLTLNEAVESWKSEKSC